MAFCSKCGYEVLSGEKFCEKCGSPVRLNQNGNTDKRTIVFEGVIHKCPSCGEPVESLQTNCSRCGFEFRDTQASESIRRFKEEYNKISSKRGISNKEKMRQQIALINSFDIPNTKEDLYEFSALAKGNIKPELMTDFIPLHMEEDDYSIQKQLSEAWYLALKRVCDKAKQAFRKTEEYLKINDMLCETEKSISSKKQDSKKNEKSLRRAEYKRKKQEIHLKEIGSKSYQKEKRESRAFIRTTLPLFIIMIVGFTMPFIIMSVKENKIENDKENLQNLYAEAQQLLNDKKYNLALEKANQIIPEVDDNKEWNNKREKLIEEINEKKFKHEIDSYKSTGKKVKVPADSDDFEGENYKDVEKRLRKAGFLFITTDTIDDVVIGLFDDVGEVEKVSINGKTDFEKGDKFPEEAEVVITYHTD